MESNLKLLSGVFVLLLIAGCAPTKIYLLPEEKEQIFSHEVQLKKEDIRVQVIQFINEKYASGKSVTQSSEEGLIIGNGIFEIGHYNVLSVSINLQMELTFFVKYIDNQYKTKYVVKRLIKNGLSDLGEEWWGYYKEQINKNIKDIDSELFNYLTKKDDKFRF